MKQFKNKYAIFRRLFYESFLKNCVNDCGLTDDYVNTRKRSCLFTCDSKGRENINTIM